MDDAAVFSVYKELERLITEEVHTALSEASSRGLEAISATKNYVPSPALIRRMVLNAVQSVRMLDNNLNPNNTVSETSSDLAQWECLISTLASHHFNYFDSKKRVFDMPSGQLPVHEEECKRQICRDTHEIEDTLHETLHNRVARHDVHQYAQYHRPAVPQLPLDSSLNESHVLPRHSSQIESLPAELQDLILSYLTPVELYHTRTVSRKFQVMCLAPTLWTSLDLSFIRNKRLLTDQLLTVLLTRHRAIRRLVLRGVNDVLTGHCFLTLAAYHVTLPNLREITCHHCTALQGGVLLRGLAKTCPNLSTLDLDGSCSLNDEHLRLLCASVPQLTKLSLRTQSDNLIAVLAIMQRQFTSRVPRNITLTGVTQMIALGVLQLRHLRLKLTEISGDLFGNLVRSMPHLESLAVSQDIAFKVNGTYLQTLAHTAEHTAWTDLKRLTLEGDVFTDQFLSSLLPLAPQLQRLTLIDCNITNRALEVIVQQLPKIANLRIEGAHPTFITEQGLTFLLSNCHSLHSLQISAALNTSHFITASERHNRWRHLIATDRSSDTKTGVTTLHKIISEYSEDHLPLDGGSKIRISADLLMSPKSNLQHLLLNHVTLTDQALAALLRHAPNLRSLSLVSTVITCTASPLEIPRTGLQSLTLVDIALADHVLFALLNSVPSVQSLCLYFVSCSVTAPHQFAATSSEPWLNLRRVILGRWQALNDTLLSVLLSRVTRLECLELIDLLVPLSLNTLAQVLAPHSDSFRALVLNHCTELDQSVVRNRFDPNLAITFM
jgi:hypothetical protein